jgi:uncharacterized protein YbjT (DUF2867 family)
MKMLKPVLIIGGAGMLGRPVVRRLVQEKIPVRVMSRTPRKTEPLLPKEVEVLEGDLRYIELIDRVMQGCGSVLVSVDTLPKSTFRPETDGLKNVITAAKRHGRPRLLVLSAIGQSIPGAREHPWWHVREKYEAQQIAKSSGLPWTIFEPTWFMESLPLFVKGKTFSTFTHANMRPFWVAGDDYARMVVASLKNDGLVEKNIPVQGPESLSLEEAGRRFISAYDPSIKMKTIPLMLLKMAGMFSTQVKDFVTLIKLSTSMTESPPDYAKWPGIPKPSMTVESYAGYCRATGDFPHK